LKSKLLLVAIIFSLSTAKANPVGLGDQDAIQGTWILISNEDGGRQKAIPADLKVTITKDKIVFTSANKPKSELAFKLDSTTHPKSIDLTVRREAWLGIYELTSDSLTICVNDDDGGKRATNFESKPSSHNDVLMVFRRVNRISSD
jgi:uncharacterized protein (TIGR03067 family)